MSWLYSQALVEEFLGDTCLDGEQSAPLSGNPTQLAYCAPDKMMVFSRLSRFGMTYKPLTESRGEELLTLYLAAFHAKTSAAQGRAQELTESAAECGITWRGWLAKYDPNSCSWKTAQCSLLGEEPESLATLPKWGMTVDGLLWEQPTLERPTSGTGSGLSVWIGTPTASMSERSEKFAEGRISSPAEFVQKWPTPIASDSRGSSGKPAPGKQVQLVDAVKFATPLARDYKSGKFSEDGKANRESQTRGKPLSEQIGGKLNPTWVEWLMGWPLGWTDLKPLEMDKFHCVQQQPGDY